LANRWAQVNLPKFGQVRFRWTRDLGGTIRSATLTRDGVYGHWYLSILVDDGTLEAAADPALPAVGIDRGVTVALALSDGRMLDQDFTSTREQAAIIRLQQQAARQQGPGFPVPAAGKGAVLRPNGGCAPGPGLRRSWRSSAADGMTSPPKRPVH
jgi:putative transposase